MMQLGVGLVLALVSAAAASDCPGGIVRCPDFMTCCELANKEYGCCPFPNAMCCKDFVHCCPASMECDIVHQSCQKNGFPVPLYWKAPIHPELIYPVERTNHEATRNEVDFEVLENNKLNQFREGKGGKCPDGRPCPDTFTCCQMHIGGYGCCPFTNAQCCSDGFHCCPSNAHCNLTTKACEHNQLQFSFEPYEMSAKPQSSKAEESSQPEPLEVSDPGGICPDGHPCPEKFTCCKVPDQGYGCCPYQDAVCCTDFIHCCPKGTNCNTTLGTCDLVMTHDVSVPAYSLVTKKLTKVPTAAMTNVSSVVCPDERYQCPDGSTCCQLGSGAYGCCPLDHASCCSDHEHCCPHGYTCIPDGCKKNTETQQPHLYDLKKKHLDFEDENGVICPDKISTCPDNNTCCDVGLGFFGCCPMPEAACCEDKIHCCPNGYKCTAGGCVKVLAGDVLPPHTLEIAQRTEDKAENTKLDSVICPDQISRCPSGYSCCEMEDGEYGCCPMEDAVCCEDKIHCCPNGFQCTIGGCVKVLAGDVLPLHTLEIAQRTEDKAERTKLDSVICPDQVSRCPPGNTCCEMEDGEYGCCPMEDAVCCEDKIHCCPNGYKCTADGCVKVLAGDVLPLHALNIATKLEDVICPDKASQCPPGNTCCEMEGGGYGCCPMEDATCCGDLQHCCPHGYWCTEDGCDRVSNTSPALPAFLRKTSLLRVQKPSKSMNDIPNVIVMP